MNCSKLNYLDPNSRIVLIVLKRFSNLVKDAAGERPRGVPELRFWIWELEKVETGKESTGPEKIAESIGGNQTLEAWFEPRKISRERNEVLKVASEVRHVGKFQKLQRKADNWAVRQGEEVSLF